MRAVMGARGTRPALGDHVLARRHLVGADDKIVLHDTRSGTVSVLGPREWALVAAADGTRDVEGIVARAAREGVRTSVAEAESFFDALAKAGLLAAEPASGSVSERERVASLRVPSRPLDPMRGFSLVCDGTGSCCRLYATILFSAPETARARALRPDVLDGGSCPGRAFLPESGSVAVGAFAVAQLGGRCAYLETDGACSLHAKGGAEAKPLGCQTFPALFVDDGEAVRVAPAVECACVIASAGRTDGASLVAPGARTWGDLPEGIFVARVPERIVVREGVEWTRPRFVAWAKEAGAGIENGCADALGHVWRLARDVDGSLPERPTSDALRPWLVRLASRATDRAISDASWRAESDLARRACAWIALAAVTLVADDDVMARALAGPSDAAGEALYLRATVHAHQLARLGAPLATALCDRAVRLLVARAIGALVEDPDPASRHPLALVEAMLRGHGLAAYVFDP